MIILAGAPKPADVVARYPSLDTTALILCETWEDAMTLSTERPHSCVIDIDDGYAKWNYETMKLEAVLGEEAVDVTNKRCEGMEGFSPPKNAKFDEKKMWEIVKMQGYKDEVAAYNARKAAEFAAAGGPAGVTEKVA